MISTFFERRFHDWVSRRSPPTRELTLNQRRIFIFPSKAGFGFIGLLLLLLMAAINYQNNMIFALAFLLASVFVITIVHSFANVSGLTIKGLQTSPGFVGDSVSFSLKISSCRGKPFFDISLKADGLESVLFTLVDRKECELSLHWQANQRGEFTPPRILLESFYPLGLLRTWSWVCLDMSALVYPKPVEGHYQSEADSEAHSGEWLVVNGSAEFYGLRDYQSGDKPKQIAWRHYAKGQGLFTKQYADYQDQQTWLDWQGVAGNLEQRLSILCHWALQLEAQNCVFGLRLPGLTLEPSSGASHQQAVLRALALYQLEGPHDAE